jgi:cytochrome o ubiquinol oxidase subunit I
MIIGGAVFGYFAGVTYWFPKVFGFKLIEKIGIYAFWCWLIGFILAFGPLYILGFMGATRRLNHYSASLGWQPLFIVAAVGVAFIGLGMAFIILNLVMSVINRKQLIDKTGDPWNGRTLEWSIPSPAPVYNFAIEPVVTDRDPFWAAKHDGSLHKKKQYEDIEMPKNTPLGMFIAAGAFVVGFAFVWHILWLGILGFLFIIGSIIYLTSNDEPDYVIPAKEVEKIELAAHSGK